MNELRNIVTIAFVISMLSLSCRDDEYLNIPDTDDLIVIDGWIEDGQFAKVLLTSNSPYFASIDSSSMRDLVLTKAKVTVTDGEKTEVLILRKNNDYFPPYIFEGNEIIGETGKIYSITAEYGGKKAWALTTIPPKVPLDTFFFELNAGSDSLGSVYIEFSDPPEIKNYYRILTKRSTKDKRFYSARIMGINDNFFSGQKFGFSLTRGPESILSSYGNEYFKLDDTVSIKFCTIDEEQYDFWNSFQNEVFNSSNPFAASMSEIKTNIRGDGLGVWGGAGVYNYTLIIK